MIGVFVTNTLPSIRLLAAFTTVPNFSGSAELFQLLLTH